MQFFYAAFCIGSAVLISWPLGLYLHKIMDPMHANSGRESVLRVLFGHRISIPQTGRRYIGQLLLFNIAMFLFAFVALLFQGNLPLNPDGRGGIDVSLILNTVASFVTNTNLQHYSGETTMSYGSQVMVLMWLQFVSAGTGLAAAAALSRFSAGRDHAGNFYQDLVRGGPVRTFTIVIRRGRYFYLRRNANDFLGAETVTTIEGLQQVIARGPVAAFIAIKQIGTNGGGFFGPNSAHPFENPNFITNSMQIIAMLILPMSCVWMYGRIVQRFHHAKVIFLLMLCLLVAQISAAMLLESGNLEGKELRFGEASSALWAAVTTSTSTGAVSSMFASFKPLTLIVPLVGMWLNVIFGGVGVGFINFYMYMIIGVFISGLMVGRTPEYLGRKVETTEIKWASLAILLHPLLILGSTAIFLSLSWIAETMKNTSFRGFTEVLYEFTSSAANNGSGLEGLSDNTLAWNISTALVMLCARFLPIILPLVIAESLSRKKAVAPSKGTLSVENWPFALVVLSTIVLVGALLFLPVAVLGPIAEYLEVSHG